MELETYEALKKFMEIAGKNDTTEEERDFMRFFEFNIAKSLVKDYRYEAVVIAKLIIAYCK